MVEKGIVKRKLTVTHKLLVKTQERGRTIAGPISGYVNHPFTRSKNVLQLWIDTGILFLDNMLSFMSKAAGWVYVENFPQWSPILTRKNGYSRDLISGYTTEWLAI